MRYTLAVLVFSLGCAHHRSVLPDVADVKVAREAPPAGCRPSSGVIEGRVGSASGTREQALEDLKREAANRGVNYVVIKTWSTYGTAVTGDGFVCP